MLGAVLLCLCTLLTVLSATRARSSRAGPEELRIATWNMCGVRQWGCEDTGSRRQKIDAVEELATAGGAGVIMLQEVCADDLALARKELGGSWHSTFQAYSYRAADGTDTPVRCAQRLGGTAGIAVLASSPLSHVEQVPTPQPVVGLRRGIRCATVATRDVQVCDAHLSLVGADKAHPRWEYRDDQLAALFGAAGPRTVFGGDLNSSPPTAADDTYRWIWPDEAYRRYRECDQASPSSRAGRDTHASGSKLDYEFTALPRTGCAVRDTGVSDHRALVMTVRTGQ